MTDIIDIKKHIKKNQKKKTLNNLLSAEIITKDGVESLVHSLHHNNFPIDDPDFQKDLALAFKFIHAAISKQFGLETPFYEAIDKFKKDVKW
tara:strand:+ start:1589 stop:1864 length:276 start_codon:yes stop_codon:yes gene_type:complete